MASGLVMIDFMRGSYDKRRRLRPFSVMDIQLVKRAARAYCYNMAEEEAVEEEEGREQQERPVYLTFEYQGIERELRTEMDLRTAWQAHSAESRAPLPVRIFTDKGEHHLALTQKALDEFTGTGREGLIGRNYITNRQATCEKLVALMNKKGFLILKAPPDSGKTSLLQLFDRYLRRSRVQTVYFTCLGRGKGPNRTWSIDDELARLGPYKKNLQDLVEDRSVQVVLLIDEGQLLYNMQKSGSAQFWQTIKRLMSGTRDGRYDGERVRVRVLVAAAYGTKTSGAAANLAPSPTATPFDIPPESTISIFAPTAADGVTLQLNDEEWQELWNNFRTHTQLQLKDAVGEYVYRVCGGQAGLLSLSLDYLKEQLTSGLQHPEDIDANAIYKLCSEKFLDRLSHVRSLMDYSDVAKISGAVLLLHQLLWEEPLRVGMNGDIEEARAVRELHVKGLVAMEQDGDEPDDDEDRQCSLRFTSPLHRVYFMRKFHTARDPPDTSAVDLDSLLMRVLARMDPLILRNTLSVSRSHMPLERCWQAEVYRSLMSVVPEGTVPSPDVGQALGGRGFVDFYVTAPYKAAVELTRDGKDLREHLTRFEQSTKYKPLLDCNAVDQFAVLDIRSPGPSQSQPRFKHQNLYTLVIDEGYTEGTFYHDGREPKRIKLMGDAGDASKVALQHALQHAT